MFKNKTILITGGTGSFGKSFVKNLLKKKFQFKKIIIFSRDELKQHEMKTVKLFNDNLNLKLRYFIGDVRDKNRLTQAFEDVDYIVHAAALKQVTTGEYNPFETLKTNVIGSQNVIDASMASKRISKVIALSTDKAVSPVNLYGASKLCADKLFISSNLVKGKKKISFSVVRYGNVMGSRGSVLPEFLKQNNNQNFFTITDSQMTRFNITLQESVDMVLWSLSNTYGGEIVIPKIKSFKITDLANAINSKKPKKIIGIREGEKIHEELISEGDSLNTYEINKYYLLLGPIKGLLDYYKKKFKAKKVKKNFRYTSNFKDNFISIINLKKLIKKHTAYEAKIMHENK
jgi:UDP-N-acetylglucosamine 4,6-dehydratase/5-epimerase